MKISQYGGVHLYTEIINELLIWYTSVFTLNIARYFVLRRTLRFRQLPAKDAVCIDPNLEFFAQGGGFFACVCIERLAFVDYLRTAQKSVSTGLEFVRRYAQGYYIYLDHFCAWMYSAYVRRYS